MVFKDQIDHNMEVYIDDLLVKSVKEVNHITDLEEAFNNLRHHQMKLNPSKCTFCVMAGKFLSFMVTEHGIKANPKKIQEILGMWLPTSKEVQQLPGRVAILSRFISKSVMQCLPFYKVL